MEWFPEHLGGQLLAVFLLIVLIGAVFVTVMRVLSKNLAVTGLAAMVMGVVGFVGLITFWFAGVTTKADGFAWGPALVAGILIFGGVAVAVRMATRLLTKEMKMLDRFTTAILNGNLEAGAGTEGLEKLGGLGQKLTAMSASIGGLVGRVTESLDIIDTSSSMLAIYCGQADQSAKDVAANISIMAEGASQQADEVRREAELADQLAQQINSMTENAKNMASSSRTAKGITDRGELVVETLNETTRKSLEANDGVVTAIANLAAKSNEIGAIMGTITGIAAQTNLLALNAAIEAARAGEAGRGFSVVAGEVRQLAEDTQNSARKISALINDMQEETAVAVEMMESIRPVGQAQTQAVAETGSMFKEIAYSVRQMDTEIASIAAISDQMEAATKVILSAISKIAEVATESADRAATVSGAAQEQTSTVTELNALAQELMDLTGNLQKTLDDFRNHNGSNES